MVDMQVACSSATFAIVPMTIATMAQPQVRRYPEICSAQVNYRDRDDHFIFGDVATALVLEEQPSSNLTMCLKSSPNRCFTD